MIKKDILETEIRTSGIKEVQDEILSVSKRIDEHRDSVKKLNAEKARLISAGKQESKEYKNLTAEIKKVNAELKKEEQNHTALYRSLNLNEMSFSQLKTRASQLATELKKTSQAAEPGVYAKLNNELKQTNAQIAKMSQGMSSVKKETNFVGSMKNAFSNMLPKIGVASILAGGLTLIKSTVTEMWGLVKNLQGDAKRSATVFGDELGYVELQADRLSQKMGVTNREFINMTTGVADLLVPLGFTRKESSQMAVDVQKLTGALNEWTAGKYGAENISEKLTKAMLGETEGLKTLGIAIRMDSDEYKALIKEKLKNGAENQAQAQALAILEMLYQKSADAQSAYASSGNELLRFQNSAYRGWRSLKESVADWFAFSSEERLDQQVRKYTALSDEFERTEKRIDTLVPRYNALTSQATLNAAEQDELRSIIDEIVKIVPQAATEFDEYGRVIGVNTSAIDAYRESARLLKIELQKDVVEDLTSRAKDELLNIRRLQEQLGNKENQQKNYRHQSNGGKGGTEQEAQNRMNIAIVDYRNKLQAAERQAGKTIATLQGFGLAADDISVLINNTSTFTYTLKTSEKAVTDLSTSYGIFMAEKNKDGSDGNEGKDNSLINKAREELKSVEKWSEETEADIKKKNKRKNELNKEIQRLGDLGVVDTKKPQKWALESDEAFAAKRIEMKKQRLDGEIATDEEYNKQLLALEVASLEARIATGKEKGADMTKLKEQLLDKQLSQATAAKKREESLLRASEDGTDGVAKLRREYDDKLRELGLYGKAIADMTTVEKAALLQIEKQYNTKLSSARLDALNKEMSKQKQLLDRKLTNLRSEQNAELAEADTLEKKRALLTKLYGDKKLGVVTSEEQALKLIRAKYATKNEIETKANLEAMLKIYQETADEMAANGGLLDGVMISEEDQQKYLDIIAKLKGELDILTGKNTTDPAKSDKKVDILGMTADDWSTLFKNTEDGKTAFDKIAIAAQAIGAAMGDVFNLMAALEEGEFKKFEKSQNSKKKLLDRQLKSGQISQEHYSDKVQKLDEETDAKREEMERKQAERQKAMAIFNAIVSTAVAVVGALGSAPFGPWNIALAAVIGALGAVQIAAIAAQPLPGMEDGGYMDVVRKQDNKPYRALYDPQRRGTISAPTVIVGENGSEYVVPADGYSNPTIRPVLDMIEQARQQGQLKQLNLSALMMANMSISGRSTGGYVAQSTPSNALPKLNANDVQLGDSEMKSILLTLNAVLGKLDGRLEHPLSATVAITGKGGFEEVYNGYKKTKSRTTIER